MTNYSTLGSNLKRGIFKFNEKITKGLKKTTKKFTFDMIFGLLAAKNCYLTGIARKLNEKIALDKTVERLSRNLMNFDGQEIIMENYIEIVKKNFDENTVFLIDDSDISKTCSKKLEGLCRVRYPRLRQGL